MPPLGDDVAKKLGDQLKAPSHGLPAGPPLQPVSPKSADAAILRYLEESIDDGVG